MSKWSSFEQDQEYTNSWRQHLESEELDEGVWDKAKGKWDKAAAKAAKIKGGAQKAGAGAEKARQAATGAYDWIANFLSGSPKDKDYSHLNMPAPDPTAKGAEPEGEETAGPETQGQEGDGEQTQGEEGEQSQDKVISTDPQSAQGTGQPQRSPEQEKLAQWAQEQKRKEDRVAKEIDAATAPGAGTKIYNAWKKEQEGWTPEQKKAFQDLSYVNESQTYDRWKVLSGIKKKVI